jgi:hypothetical protein
MGQFPVPIPVNGNSHRDRFVGDCVHRHSVFSAVLSASKNKNRAEMPANLRFLDTLLYAEKRAAAVFFVHLVFFSKSNFGRHWQFDPSSGHHHITHIAHLITGLTLRPQPELSSFIMCALEGWTGLAQLTHNLYLPADHD